MKLSSLMRPGESVLFRSWEMRCLVRPQWQDFSADSSLRDLNKTE